MKRIFVDLDGTLVEFDPNASIEIITSKGYFKNRPGMKNMIQAVTRLVEESEEIGINVYILTSVFIDDHSISDKKAWVENNIPCLKDKIIFVPYGTSKSDFLARNYGICEDDIILEDFSEMLKSWHGVGIKVYNGINNTHHTWKGYVVNADSESEIIFKTIKGICLVA